MADQIQDLLDRLLTTRQVAERYGVSVYSVQHQIKRGNLKAYKLAGYFYLLAEEDLPEEWPGHK